MTVQLTENNKWADVKVGVFEEDKIDIDVIDANGGSELVGLQLSFSEARLLSHLLLAAVTYNEDAATASICSIRITNRNA